MLATNIKSNHLATELHIGICKAVGKDTVTHDTAQRVRTTQSLVHHTLDKQGIEVGVHIEWRLTCDIVLCTNAICESHSVAIDRYIVAEVEVELQVVVTRSSLLTVLSIESSRVGEERIGIDTFGWAGALVTAVVSQAQTQVWVPTTECLVLVNDTPLNILLVHALHVFIHRFLSITVSSRVIHILLAIEHINIALVNHVAEYTKTCIPLDIFPNSTFNVGSEAEKVTFILIERARLVVLQHTHLSRVFLPLVEILVINRLIAIEAIEIAHGVWLISSIKGQTVLGNQVLAIIVHAEDTIVLGGISRLRIQRVDILRVLRTIAIVVNIGQSATLETQVSIKSYRWQYAEVPTRLNLTTERVHLLNFLLLGCLNR